MSKSNKNVNVKLDTKKIDGTDCEVLSIGKKEVGYIKPNDESKFDVIFGEDVFHTKSIDEGVETLISQYHLHRG
ncbi:DUF2969 family protein [Apilactobacillus micheneri]|uniref:DUF2969 domain-containing protein n=1 Tax=Apilactobacillus micheneri TaxID=1899430 RepID=A0A2S2JJA6_9LACO|nr:DUF2969 family protein [Apilactobacillus micheneri]TPR24317.1 DUF2969 domain-containing protein [Apilactobacillus micheneri]TPR25336.1 DUF2969 domain-containing protein [Apilactobacillus micheneri]TPR27648.1 DUF2969 domain-containing protein [Apilactobacillus micheneri]TPR28913.1 DUF2969 domain-containing protein [Apilactobacillus micheneri]TPR29935.1 DUF2969 domain-containing protein [Apilactobacillus micheneri]